VELSCAPELLDSLLRSAAALNDLLVVGEGSGVGGLLLTPRLAAAGDIELKGWRAKEPLNPGESSTRQ
jgi:hypothetical protein